MSLEVARRVFERAAKKDHVCNGDDKVCSDLQYQGIKKFVDNVFGWRFWQKQKPALGRRI